jgi:hypothetical protein
MFQKRTIKDLVEEDNLMPYNLEPRYTKINLGCVLRHFVLPLSNKIMGHNLF